MNSKIHQSGLWVNMKIDVRVLEAWEDYLKSQGLSAIYTRYESLIDRWMREI